MAAKKLGHEPFFSTPSSEGRMTKGQTISGIKVTNFYQKSFVAPKTLIEALNVCD